MAAKMPSRSLKKDCAAILESMKVSSVNLFSLNYFKIKVYDTGSHCNGSYIMIYISY